jgi:hypothetical protein
VWHYYPGLWGIRLLPFVALLGLALPAGKHLRLFAWLLFLSFAVNGAFVCLTDHPMPRYHYQALPGMLLVGVGVIWTALGRLRRPSVRLVALLLAVVAMVDVGDVRAAATMVEVGARRVDPGDMVFVQDHTSEDAVIVSDVSWVVAWETGRRSIRAHFDRGPDGAPTLSVLRFNDEFLPIDAVYIRFLDRRTRIAHRNLRSDARFNELFPRRHKFPSGAVFYYR